MSEPVSISTGIAGRYATAVFELAKEGKKLKALETDVDTLDAALAESADFRDLIASPLYSREQQAGAIVAIAKKMKLSPVVANTLNKVQQDKLAKTLTATVGKDVKINMSVDESLIGGLVVKVGSKMIDTSIRSKLASLQNSMKEVG